MTSLSDLVSESPCVCLHIRRAGRVITQLYDSRLRRSGIRITQYSLLRYIDLAGGSTIGELGEALCLEQSTVTRNVRVLSEGGYVRLDPASGDKRRKILSLTKSGRAKLDEATVLWREAQNDIRRELGEDGIEDLMSALKRAAGFKGERSDRHE
ncbi:MAG: MarR family winged helix-turn-helix transcriptional regulator [Synergistaceae bacterium]|nr:MarR family winged helix-turn-helix transcriptional regulator [Synergistaceae bacterium]